MNDDERKTMIRIAQEVDDLKRRITYLERHEDVSLGARMPGFVFNAPRITSTIEHTDRMKRFKMDVQFTGADRMLQDDRMRKCEVFLRELEDLFREFGVIRLTGTYVSPTESVQA